MAININKKQHFAPEDNSLKGRSKFWGFPDMPDKLSYPYYEGDPLTFICQINLEELHSQIGGTNGIDAKNLPAKGMLYFFANIDYFLGWSDNLENGIGLWPKDSFRVLYAEDISNLNTHKSYFEDGTPAAPDACSMVFSPCPETEHGHKLLGEPFFDEVLEEISAISEGTSSKYLSLLQIDEDDDWDLRFYDSGMINFIIDSESLLKKDFSKCKFYFHSL